MHDDDEWGNLGDFDANDPLVNVRAANRRIHYERKTDPVRAKIWHTGNKAAQQRKWANKEWAEQMTAKLVACAQDPERNKKVSNAKKEYWKNEQHREKASALSRANWQDPEYVESVIASQRLAVSTPFGEFISQAEFSRATKLNFKDKQREMPHLYYVLDDGPGEPTTETVCVTPLGEFKNKRVAFDAHKNNLYTPKPTTQKGKPWVYQVWWKWVTTNRSNEFYTKTMIRREWKK